MKTRRNFIKGLFGFTGVLLTVAGIKTVSKATKKPKYSKDFEAGVLAAIQAGKTGISLGWTCKTRLNQHQRPLSGKIQNIDFKNKTITVHCDALIAAEKAGRTQKPFGNKPAWGIKS